MKLPSFLSKRLLSYIGSTLLIYFVIMSIFVPAFVRPKLEKMLSTTLQRTVTIDDIDFNPFLFIVTVRDFRVKDKTGPTWMFRFSTLRVDLELSSLWKHGPVIRELSLEQPQVRISRFAENQYSFSDLLEARPKSAKTDSELPLFSLNNIRITGGRLVFDDQLLKSRQEISDFKLALPFVSTLPDRVDDFIEPGLSGRLNGHVFALTGKTKPFEDSRETLLNFDLKNLNLPDYQPYMPVASDVNLLSGMFSTQLQLIFRQGKTQQSILLKGGMTLNNLQLRQGEQAIFALPVLQVEGIDLDLSRRQLQIAKIAADEGDLSLVRQSDGTINLSRVMKASSADTASAPQAVAKPSEPAEVANTSPWRVSVAQFALNKFAIKLLDQTIKNAVPLRLHQFNLRVKDLDTKPSSPAHLQFSTKVGSQGTMAIQGTFVPLPFSAKWAIDFAQLDAAYSQPYFTRWLNIGLASGYLAAKGDVTLATQPNFSANYQGNIGISDFYALDKLSGQDFLKWQTLDFNGINADAQPLKVDIKEIALRDFYSRLILNKNGRMNLNDILRQGDKATSVTTSQSASAPVAIANESTPVPPIHIDKIVVAGGNIRYSDNLIQPNFTVHMRDMAGVLAGLSSDEGSRANIDLRGSIDRIAPVKIAGTLNPLAKQRYVDIKASVKGYELTSASTYAAKYAGYGIDKGKMSFDLAYFIEGNKLKASNQLLLDQLTLGAESGSSEATSLPVRFALALLTDRRGQININLPIEGTLDDPEFKIGSVIWKVLGTLVEKAVTSPFDLLASLAGGQADLSYVEFVPGQAELSDASVLETLAKALDDRPALNLDIVGWVDVDTDREGLKQQVLQEKLRKRKMAQFNWWRAPADADKKGELSKAEYARFLAEEFEDAGLAKPKVENASAPVLSAAQVQAHMEKLLLANIQITTEMYRDLALARARNAKDVLQKMGVKEERLFIVNPQLSPDKSSLKSGSAARVQFVLK